MFIIKYFFILPFVFFIMFNTAMSAESKTIGNIYFSQPDKSGLMTIRAVEWTAPLAAGVINSCNNSATSSQTCIVEISCWGGNGVNSSGILLGNKPQMTEIDLRDIIYNSVGGLQMPYGGCFRKSGVKYILIHGPMLRVGSVPLAGGTSTNINTYAFGKTAMPNESPNLSCNAISSNTTIDFGDIEYNSVNGASKSIDIELSCINGDGFAHLSSTGYERGKGISLRNDDSLTADLDFNDVPADLSSILFIENNTTRNLTVKATLRATNGLKGGFFSGSFVVKIFYD